MVLDVIHIIFTHILTGHIRFTRFKSLEEKKKKTQLSTSLCIAPSSTPLKITSKTLKSEKHMEEPLRPKAVDSTKSMKSLKSKTMETVQIQRSPELVGGRDEPGGQRGFLKQ